jgi:hypothetical protein
VTVFNQAAAAAALDNLSFGPENLRLARYWLSLWNGDALPLRAAFDPKKAQAHLPGLAIFEVKPDESVRCRLFGSALVTAIGKDITGCDWLAMTKEDQRATRLFRYSSVARGAIARCIRRGIDRSGETILTEEIMLPFGDIAEDGTRLVLYHANWRPVVFERGTAELSEIDGIAAEFQSAPLMAA